jgi:uncharacterized protein YeaO (DUF488 family)
MTLKLKRAYEPTARGDGVRILVDRLWPRGVKKPAVDLWLKDVAPSDALRKWFGHKPERWVGFRSKYRKELAKNKDALSVLRNAIRGRTVTLLYGARDEEHNQAVVLADVLKPRRTKAKKVSRKTTKTTAKKKKARKAKKAPR